MTANFKETYWLLDHNFQLTLINNRQHYLMSLDHKCIYVIAIGPDDDKSYSSHDRYVCHINKATGKGDILFSSTINFNSSEWITATGITPKHAINNAITLALTDSKVQHKEELRGFSLMLNPIIWFFANLINQIINK